MARSFSNAKLFSIVVVDRISNALGSFRRGYAAAAAQGVVSRGVARNGVVVRQTREEIIVGAKEKVAWVPDPVTGCYRPENCADEIDVAELRAMLLKKN